MKNKFICRVCKKELNGEEEVYKHKEENPKHYTYDMVNSNLRLNVG